MKYKEIRKYQTTNLSTEFMICPYCQLFSPFFTNLFLKLGTRPNVITVYMIISGLLGAAFFAIPTAFTQIVGAVLIHVWFILDCSDGEVARITKTFSTFGKEIDYTAHVINHPFFSIAFLIAMYCSGNYDMRWVIIVMFVFTVLETWGRHLCSFEDIYSLKLPEDNRWAIPEMSLGGQIKYFIVNSLHVYPNFALLFPIAFGIDCLFGSTVAFWLMVVYTVVNAYYMPRLMYGWVRRIVKA